MNAFKLLRTLACLSVVLSSAISAVGQSKPNIVFILADDLGYGDVGCYGQEKIKTPNIDRLAAQGVRFTQHYTGAPVCAPARCVLMTGQHLGHAEIRGNKRSGNGRVFPGQFPITEQAVTIAEVLKTAGYETGGFGKWGLGPSNTSGSPMKQGFDRFYGYNCQRNAHSFYPPFLDSDEAEQRVNNFPVPGHHRQPEGEVLAETYRAENYAPDLILKEALKFVDKNKKKPFFLYLPFVEPHVAMQPPQEWLDRYPKEWDEAHGAYRGQNGYLPHPRPRAAYASMISDLDEHVGTILERLEKHGLTENTIVIFTSDNGPTHGGKDSNFHIGGAACTFFNSNDGLRGYKGSCYEGGIRIPCVVRWPGKTKPDSVCETPSYFPDWFPTLATIAGGKTPDAQPLDGIDLTSVLQGKPAPRRTEPMIWDFAGYGGIVAIRDGKWKAVRTKVNRKNNPGSWELYDLDADRNETKNLAVENPEIVSRLEAAFLKTRTAEPDFPSRLYDKDSKHTVPSSASQSISKLGTFGTLMNLEVEFVEKNRTYWEQNLVKTRFMARVLSVDNLKLEDPVRMEYVFSGNEQELKDAKQFREGKIYQLEGYEDIYTFGSARGWQPGSQFSYGIHHKVVLRFPKAKDEE